MKKVNISILNKEKEYFTFKDQEVCTCMDDVRKKIIILHNDILKKTATLDDLLNHKLKKLFKRKSILLPTISDTTKYRYYKKIGHRILLECESIDNLIISDKSEMDNFKKDACYFELDDKIYLLVLSEEE